MPEMQTAEVQVNVNGNTKKQQLDATDDREIHALEFHIEGVDAASDVDINAWAWLGADERVMGNVDGVSDNTQILGAVDLEYNSDGTGSGSPVPSGKMFDYSEPFEWDENVTLTLEGAESGSTQTVNVTAHVFYTEGSGL